MTEDAPPTFVEGAEAFPDELKNRDQWLYWNRSADRPRKPLETPTSEFGASWSDPDTWVNFTEAVEEAEPVTNAGIGFVFSNGNDDYDEGAYGAIDIDGCVDEDGEIKDWVPTLRPFLKRDAYIEWSPSYLDPDSDGGLHIPIEGFEPPDWWTDTHFTADEHEGVEAYDQKFFTVTGAKHEMAGDSVVSVEDVDVDAWLREAYKAIEGEDPLEKDDDSTADDWLTEDDVREALDHIDPDQSYPFWRDIGFSLADYFDKATAKALFKEWSKSGAKWDSDAPDLADTIIDRSTKGGGRTIGSIVHHAVEGGWDPPSPTSNDTGTPSATGLSEVDGGYGYWSQTDDDDWEFQQVTNFTLTTNAVIDTDDGVVFDLTVTPRSGRTYEVQVPADAFNERRSFLQEVVTGATTTVQYPRPATNVLNDLRLLVSHQDAPRRKGVTNIGLHGDEFVTPNGVLGPDGWKDDPDHMFTGEGLAFYDKWQADPETSVDLEEIRTILSLLPETRTSERFLPVLCWFYAVPVRPLIMDWEGQFNHLSIVGKTGSGKTSTLGVLWQCFGMDSEPVEIGSTPFTRLTTFSSTNSIPVWFDEYKPAELDDGVSNDFHDKLRKSSRGTTAYRGKPDLTTDAYPMTAPVVASGEQHLQGAAEQRRTIMVHFQQSDTEPGSASAQAFEEVTGYELSQHAVAYYQWLLNQDEEDLKERWDDARQTVTTEIDVRGLSDFPIQGLQTILFGYNLYMNFAVNHCGVAKSELPSRDDAYDAVTYAAEMMLDDEVQKSHLDEFFEMMAIAALDGYLTEDEHYTFVHEGTEAEELRVNIAQTFPKLRKFARDHDVTDSNLFDSSRDYTSRCAEVHEEGDHYVVSVHQNTPPIGRAIGIEMDAAKEALTDFSKSKFVTETEDTPLSDVTVGQRRTVTGQVVSVRESDGEKTAQRGVIVDEHGNQSFVIWSDCPDRVEEGQCYRFERVKIGQYQGNTQIEVGGSSSITEIQQGAGLTPAAETVDDTLPSYSLKPKVMSVVNSSPDGRMDRDHLVDTLAGLTYDEERVDECIDSLVTNGRLVRRGAEVATE